MKHGPPYRPCRCSVISLSAVKSIKRFSKARVEKQEETVFPADLLCHSPDCCFRDELLIAVQPNATGL